MIFLLLFHRTQCIFFIGSGCVLYGGVTQHDAGHKRIARTNCTDRSDSKNIYAVGFGMPSYPIFLFILYIYFSLPLRVLIAYCWLCFALCMRINACKWVYTHVHNADSSWHFAISLWPLAANDFHRISVLIPESVSISLRSVAYVGQIRVSQYYRLSSHARMTEAMHYVVFK